MGETWWNTICLLPVHRLLLPHPMDFLGCHQRLKANFDMFSHFFPKPSWTCEQLPGRCGRHHHLCQSQAGFLDSLHLLGMTPAPLERNILCWLNWNRMERWLWDGCCLRGKQSPSSFPSPQGNHHVWCKETEDCWHLDAKRRNHLQLPCGLHSRDWLDQQQRAHSSHRRRLVHKRNFDGQRRRCAQWWLRPCSWQSPGCCHLLRN